MFSASGRASLRPAPRLGEDTWDVLTEVGLPAAEVGELTGNPPGAGTSAASVRTAATGGEGR